MSLCVASGSECPAHPPVTRPAHGMLERPMGTLTDPAARPLSRSAGSSVPANVRDHEMTFFNTEIQRTYKDKDSEGFKSTHSLGKDDLPRVQLLLGRAWEWIVDQEAALRKKAAK